MLGKGAETRASDTAVGTVAMRPGTNLQRVFMSSGWYDAKQFDGRLSQAIRFDQGLAIHFGQGGLSESLEPGNACICAMWLECATPDPLTDDGRCRSF